MRRCITISRISTTCFSVVWRISVRRSAISWQPGRRGALPAGRGCVERPGLMWSISWSIREFSSSSFWSGSAASATVPRRRPLSRDSSAGCANPVWRNALRRNLHGRRGGCVEEGLRCMLPGMLLLYENRLAPDQLRGVHAVGRCAARQGNRLRHAAAAGQGAPWRQGAPCVCSSFLPAYYTVGAAEFSVLLRGFIEQCFRVPLLSGEGSTHDAPLRRSVPERWNAGGQSSLTDRYGPDAARPRRMRNGAAGSPAGAMQRFH